MCIARSTMESEFIALNKAREEAEWLRQFLKDISLWPKPVPTICIHCDNQAVISWAQNFVYNGKFIHIHADITLLDSCSQIELSQLTLCCQKIT